MDWTGLVDKNQVYEYILGTPFVRYMGYFFTFLSYFGGLCSLVTCYRCLSKRRFRAPKTAINVNLWSRKQRQEVEDFSDEDDGQVNPDAPPAYDEK